MKIYKLTYLLSLILISLSFVFPINYSNVEISKNDISIFFDEYVLIDKVEIQDSSISLHNLTFQNDYVSVSGNTMNFQSLINLTSPNDYLSSKIYGCNDILATNYDNRSLILDNSCTFEDILINIVEPEDSIYLVGEEIPFNISLENSVNYTYNYSINGNTYNSYEVLNFSQGNYLLDIYAIEYFNTGQTKEGTLQKNISIIPEELFIFTMDNNQSGTTHNLEGYFTHDVSFVEYFNGVEWVSLDEFIVNKTISKSLNFNNLDIDTLYLRYLNPKNDSITQNATINVSKFKMINSNLIGENNFTSKSLELNFTADYNDGIKEIYYVSNGVKYTSNYLIEGDSKSLSGEVYLNDFGENTLEIVATDNFGYSSNEVYNFNFTKIENDNLDEDLYLDENDPIVYSEDIVTTNLEDLDVLVDSEDDLNQNFKEEKLIEVLDDNGDKIIDFLHNFSKGTDSNNFSYNDENKLVLDFTLLESNEDNLSKILIKSLKKQEEYKKTIYLDRIEINNRSTDLCVVNREVSSFDEVSDSCSGDSEYLFKEDGIIDGIEVISNDTNYTIKNLDNSLVKQVCSRDLEYSDWEVLDSNNEIRYYTDKNNCIEDGSETRQREIIRSGGGGGGRKSREDSNNEEFSIFFNKDLYEIYLDDDKIESGNTFNSKTYTLKIITNDLDEITYDYTLVKNLYVSDLIETYLIEDNKVLVSKKNIALLNFKNENNKLVCASTNDNYRYTKDTINCDKDFEKQIECEKECIIENSNYKIIYTYSKEVKEEIESEVSQLIEKNKEYESSGENLLKIINLENKFMLYLISIIITSIVLVVGIIFMYERKYKFTKEKSDKETYKEYDLNTHILKIKEEKSSFRDKIKKHFKKNKTSFKDYIHSDGRYIVNKSEEKEEKPKDVEDEIKQKLENKE